MSKARTRTKQFRIGDEVDLNLGTRKVRVRIVEDRGRIGKGGRQLFRVERVRGGPEGRSSYEVPAEDLLQRKSASRGTSTSRVPARVRGNTARVNSPKTPAQPSVH